MREELINKIKNYYNLDRLNSVDSDFLEFEEEMSSLEDLETILNYLSNENQVLLVNPYNSILLYVTSLTDEFDFIKARADTIGGSPPDIDLDYDAKNRYKIIDHVIEKWGKENVANIVTFATLKPRSLAKKLYSVNEYPSWELDELLKEIPNPKFGKEPTLAESYKESEKLATSAMFEKYRRAGEVLEDLVSHVGVHAAGLVISDSPIHDVLPLMIRTDKEEKEFKETKVQKVVTQFDMKEVETLGLIKFDFLSIENLSIIQECCEILKRDGIEIDPYKIPDRDKKAYDLISSGNLTGLFQMETSGVARTLASQICPGNLKELSDISALNRPGPMQAGLDVMYIENKKNGYAPSDMPEVMKNILKDSYYTIIYQEDVMRICSELANFSLKESDDIRRAMGKKDKPALELYSVQFIAGCVSNGVDEQYAKNLWETLLGFAD